MAVTEGVGFKRGEREKGLKLAFIDVKRTYFYAKAKKDIFIRLPEGDREPGMGGRLLKSMYGTQDAASNWEDCYMDFAREICFNSGIASPCVFKQKTRRLWLTVHGYDFTLLGSEEDLDWFQKELKAKFEVKVRVRLGPGADDSKAIRVLNPIVEWTRDG